MSHDREPPQNAGQREGRYSNYFEIGHNAVEFLLDFGQFYSECEGAQLHTRIVTSPIYAKVLLSILGESIERYEQTFGAIPRGDGEGN